MSSDLFKNVTDKLFIYIIQGENATGSNIRTPK